MLNKSKSFLLLYGNCNRIASSLKLNNNSSSSALLTTLFSNRAHNSSLSQFIRLQSTSSSSSSSANQDNNSNKESYFRKLANSLNYSIAIAIGATAGLFAGYIIITDEGQIIGDNLNEVSRSMVKFEATKLVENIDSKYRSFPLKFHLYQYESCPYSAQVRSYLDYFGFTYNLTEVDSYSKEEITKFTKARILPILVIEDPLTKKRWHLANSTSILSALESVRNDKPINYSQILDQYLPILKGNVMYNTFNPFKYHISNSELNSIEWRKWINNQAIPTFRLNSIQTLKDLFETFDYIAETSHWSQRYGWFKWNYVYYSHAFTAFRSRSALMNQLDSNSNRKPRKLLHSILDKWEEGLGDNKFIDGNDYPTIADISMYGNARAYEGCALFREAIAKHPKFRSWYERMKTVVLKGQESIENKRSLYSTVSDDSSASKVKEAENAKDAISFIREIVNDDDDGDDDDADLLDDLNAILAGKKLLTSNEKIAKLKSKIVANKKLESSANKTSEIENLNSTKLSESLIFRILTVNYLAHLAAFTYAAWMK